MSHVLMLVQGNILNVQDFLNQVAAMKYECPAPDGVITQTRANVQEVKLISVVVPRQSVDQLLRDISPYLIHGGHSKDIFGKLFNFAAKILGFKRPPPHLPWSGRVWKRFTNVHVLGVIDDDFIGNQEQL